MRKAIVAGLSSALLAGGTLAAGASGATLVPAPTVVNRLAPGTGVTADAPFLVTFDPARTTLSAVTRAITSHGGLVHPYRSFPVVAGLGRASAITAAAAVPGVRALSPVTKITLLDTAPNHAIGVDAVQASTPAGLGDRGAGVTVGIIDSGADGTHPDLTNQINRNVKVAFTWVACDGDVTAVDCGPGHEPLPAPVDVGTGNSDTSSGHGTHVAGTVAGDGTASGGVYTGVAPAAKLDIAGVGDGDNILWALDGFDFLLTHAAEDNLVAISNSWGSAQQNVSADTSAPAADDPIRVAIEAALGQGISVVFAAGNDGTDTAGTTSYCDAAHPYSNLNPYGLVPGVVSVAASLRDGAGIAGFSSCGSVANRDHDPTVTAPGDTIVSTRDSTGALIDGTTLLASFGQRYVAISGTSMATPHVSGVIALIQSARVQRGLSRLTPAEVKALLTSTAVPMADVETRRQGAGLVDAAAAVASVQGVSTPTAAVACPVVQDPAGDATNVIVATPLPSDDALDLRAASLTTAGGRITVRFTVTKLTIPDPASGFGQYYELEWSSGGHRYYAVADYQTLHAGTGGPVVQKPTFQVGNLDSLRTAYAVDVTGSFDTASNTVTVSFPVNGNGSYDFTGATLGGIQAISRRDLNNVLPDADTAYDTQAYAVGSSC